MSALIPVTAECLVQAAYYQKIPLPIILGLLKTEGGHVGGVSVNTNGSKDLGPIQINDRAWVPTLAKMHFGGDQEAAYEALRDNGCYNVHVGAWIFHQYVDEANGNLAEAVGLYNSHTPVHKQAYQRRFIQNFVALFGGVLNGK